MSKVILFSLPPHAGDFFPISLGYVAARLKSKGIDVFIDDFTINKARSLNTIEETIKRLQPRIVGFSGYQENMRAILALSEMAKDIDPGVITIMGGPQATFMPKEALLSMPSIDVLCRGEGESVLPDFCECIDSGGGLGRVKGIAFKDNGVAFENKPQSLSKCLDEFESPFREGVFNFSDHKIACMLASRGCPFTCLFCYTPQAFMRTIRLHSPQRILADMQICLDNGISDFWFADPSFAFNKQWALKIMNGIIDRKWDISIWLESHTALVDKELLTVMAKAGVKKIAYGLETADKKVLRIINKNVDLDRLRGIVKITQDLGIEVELMHIYGLPGQTYASARRTMEFVKDLDVKIKGNSEGQPLKLFFGAPLCDNPQKFGIYPSDKRRPPFLSPGAEFKTTYMDRRIIKKVGKLYAAESYLEQIAGSAGISPAVLSRDASNGQKVGNIISEVKIVGGSGCQETAISGLLQSLFWAGNTFLRLTLLAVPIETLQDIRVCLKRFKYNSCALRIEINGGINSEWAKAIMRLHRYFKKEADYFDSFNRLQVIPLIRLQDLGNACRKRSGGLRSYFKRSGLDAGFLLRWSDFDDARQIDLALKEPPLRGNKTIIYSAAVNREIIRLAAKYNIVRTLHDGIDGCFHP